METFIQSLIKEEKELNLKIILVRQLIENYLPHYFVEQKVDIKKINILESTISQSSSIMDKIIFSMKDRGVMSLYEITKEVEKIGFKKEPINANKTIHLGLHRLIKIDKKLTKISRGVYQYE